MSNSFSFAGYIGKDAEVVTTKAGKRMLRFSVANTLGYGRDKVTQWVACRRMLGDSDGISTYLKKGTYVFVSGELKLETYTDRDNITRSLLAVYANIIVLGSGPSGRSASPSDRFSDGPGDFEDSDIPF